MKSEKTKKWLKAAGIRAAKTFAQTAGRNAACRRNTVTGRLGDSCRNCRIGRNSINFNISSRITGN